MERFEVIYEKLGFESEKRAAKKNNFCFLYFFKCLCLSSFFFSLFLILFLFLFLCFSFFLGMVKFPFLPPFLLLHNNNKRKSRTLAA